MAKTVTPKNAKNKWSTLLEQSFTDNAPQVDRDEGVIRDVKVLGTISKNGREYSQHALADACKIFEGISVNIDHNRDNPRRERGFMESIGTLNGLYLRPDGVYAKEFRIKKTHPNAPVIFESAEKFPKNFGLSINAEGEMVKRGGKYVVESIKKAQSVDVVSNPATTDGIFESVDHTRKARTVKVTVKQLVEAHGTPEMKSRLVKLCEDDSSGALMQPVDVAAQGDGSGLADGDGDADDLMSQDPMDALSDAFIALVASVMQNADLALADKIKQITAILTTQDQLLNGDAGGSTTVKEEDQSMDDSTSDTQYESIKSVISDLKNLLIESNKKTVARQDELEARQILVESHIKPLPDRIKSLVAEKDEAKRTALLESWPVERAIVPKPRQSSPLFESASEDKFPSDHRSFMAKLKR